MPYAPVGDLKIYYELHGPEDAEPLFLFNGAFGVIGPNSDWTYQLPRFAEHYRVIAFEHRGHGRTNNPANRFVNYEQLAGDAARLLAYLNVPRAHMVGFSDGAITLLEFARRYPQTVDTLVVIGANYYNDQTCLEAMETLTPEYIEEKYPAWAEQLEQQHGTPGSGYWKELGRQLRAMWMEYPNYSKAQLAEISVPTLVMTGQRDHFGSISQTLDIHYAIKGSELCIVPGASHPVMSQRPEISTLIVLDYLARQRKRPNK
ncbi:MAG TPA: alpha/beta hydrolase [Chloroflexia bacterium]|nr:alpha/beta hydrolase [Chloroflexia bacterium]